MVTLHYAATLLRASEILAYLGLKGEAIAYRNQAEKVKQDVIKACWDENRQLFAENPDKSFFDERANIMAVTAHVSDEKFQRELLHRSINDSTISKSSYYFRFNHFNEMRRLGAVNQIDQALDIWKALLPLNLTTTPERIAKQRSEAHPWSGSPAIAFIQLVAGIAPAEPGFKSVRIEPGLGKLKEVKGVYPHYLGDITVALKVNKKGRLEGIVELPEGLRGYFKYNGIIVPLSGGMQEINM